MKIAMFHSEAGGVGFYRVWQPAKYMKLDVTTFGYMEKPPVLPITNDLSEVSAEAKRNFKKYGSWETIGKNHDILVSQRTDDLKQVALLLGIRETFRIPLVLEIDDNFLDIERDHLSWDKYGKEGEKNNYHVIKIDKDDLDKYNALLDSGEVHGAFLENSKGLFFIQDLCRNKRAIVSQFASQVDAMTVSTEALKKTYSHLCDDIYVLPNSIDPDIWKVEKKTIDDGKIRIGWAGGVHHYYDLLEVWSELQTILDLYPNVEFHYVNIRPDFLEAHPKCFYHPGVRLQDYPQLIANLDLHIAIAPLKKNKFNTGKSNLKWLEYSILGLPTIASDWHPYRCIESGVDGILCKSGKDWVSALKKLINNPSERLRIAQNAKKRILKEYNAKTNGKLWDEAYKEIWQKHKISEE